MSIAFDRGDPRAIKYRRERVVEATLRQVDEKGNWLSKNPKGKNYDITKYHDILPIGVSPFVEFIPSLDFRYWISEKIPRVVTPEEFHKFVKNPAQVGTAMNRIPILKVHSLGSAEVRRPFVGRVNKPANKAPEK